MWRDIFLENRDALAESLGYLRGELDKYSAFLEAGDESGIATAIQSAASYREELLEYEDISPETLFRVTVRIPDQPGVLSQVMTALGDAQINVEDLTLHHVSRSVGGDLVLFIAGRVVAETAGTLLDDLGYPTVVKFTGDSSD
jgi:prephenate dehydrogenase